MTFLITIYGNKCKNAYDANLLNGAKKVYDAEYDRIEKLLFETVPNYMGR